MNISDLYPANLLLATDVNSESSSSGTLTLNCNEPTHEATLTENITTVALSNTTASKSKNVHLLIIGDASSSYTVAFPAAWYWAGDKPVSDTITVAANEIWEVSITAWGTAKVLAAVREVTT